MASIRINPEHSNAHYNLGIAYRDTGDRDTALGFYDRAIELRPRDADYRYARGNLHSDRRDYDAATSDYDAAIALVPTFANALYNRASPDATRANPLRPLSISMPHNPTAWTRDAVPQSGRGAGRPGSTRGGHRGVSGGAGTR